jgi:GNAT superfamily N-acetyltransferase
MEQTITFKYHFSSGTGSMAGSRYNKEVTMEIFSEDEDGFPEKQIGKVKFHIIHVVEAYDEGYNLYEVFDDKEYTFRIGQEIFDFDETEANADILEFYDEVMFVSNICILERIEILPDYRGNKYGAKAIKDIVFQFSASCALFVAEVFPLQFEADKLGDDEWKYKLALDNFETDEAKAFKRLDAYYQSMGFDKIKKYKNLVFINPFKLSKNFRSINLEE